MDRNQWHWHVLGAGAMGCLWAARLAAAGWPVSLLLRDPERLVRYRAQGGVRLEAEGRQRMVALPASTAHDRDPVRALLLATKSGDALPALASVRHRLRSDSVIVLMQNGVAVQQLIHDALGPQRVLCLSTSHGAWLRAPFHVVHAGAGEAWLGSLEEGQSGATLVGRALSQLPSEGMQVQREVDMRRRLWRKFAVNCAVNALTVLHDCRNGELLTRPAATAELTALCEEIATVLEALPRAPAIGPLWPQVVSVLEASAANVSSTLQDVRAGRPTELGWLNGWLLALAGEQGLECPRNRAIARQLSIAIPDPATTVHALRHQ